MIKILILNEKFAGVTENRLYDVTDVDYQNLEGYSCEKEEAEFETFYFINDDNIRAYEYRNIRTKECSLDGNDFEVFETDLDCANYLIKKYNLNVEVSTKIS